MPVPVGPARNLAAPRALRDVVEAMIVDSHNDGMFRIRDAIPPEFYLHIYEAFGLRRLLNTPMRPGDENVIRAREIGQVLRRLYEGTYLPPARSEQALAMLSRARFPWGIRAAVPGVPMAHKFGEYVYQVDGGWEVQFHHCAVVYEPNPYVLCVMTRGRDFDELVDAVEVLAEQAHAALLDLSPPG